MPNVFKDFFVSGVHETGQGPRRPIWKGNLHVPTPSSSPKKNRAGRRNRSSVYGLSASLLSRLIRMHSSSMATVGSIRGCLSLVQNDRNRSHTLHSIQNGSRLSPMTCQKLSQSASPGNSGGGCWTLGPGHLKGFGQFPRSERGCAK